MMLAKTANSTISADPRVSVIIIFFNAAAHIEQAIESVLAQDFDDFELLLVDDGSTDSSSGIAKRFELLDANRIRYVKHPGHQNRGMSASRNLGIRCSRGEFIAFIDADDRWRPAKLREQVELLDRLAEVDAICGTVNYWASWNGGEDRLVPTGHVRNRAVPPIEASVVLYPLGRAGAPCPSDLLLRRSAVEAVGGFEDAFTGPLQMYEDQAFLGKFYLERTIYFSDKQWLDYRLHDESCSSRVAGEGRYHNVRRHYLEWFEAYLAGTPHRRRFSLRLALARALLPYRWPRAYRTARWIWNVIRKAERRAA